MDLQSVASKTTRTPTRTATTTFKLLDRDARGKKNVVVQCADVGVFPHVFFPILQMRKSRKQTLIILLWRIVLDHASKKGRKFRRM
jgi:hypothetical protein